MENEKLYWNDLILLTQNSFGSVLFRRRQHRIQSLLKRTSHHNEEDLDHSNCAKMRSANNWVTRSSIPSIGCANKPTNKISKQATP